MITIALLACVSALFPPHEEPAHPEWLKADLERIRQFTDVMKTKDLDVETLIAKFGATAFDKDHDAGFGVRRVKLQAYGGYATIWIDVLAESGAGDKKSRVAELRAQQYGSGPDWKLIQPTLAKAWGECAQPIENGFEFVFRDQSLAADLRRRTADALGGAARIEVPKELTAAFDLLTSPFEEVVIGTSYGEDGAVPPGRKEIEQLVKAERWDLVQSVLRGINPEGRLYAAWVLRRRANTPLNAGDARAIATLLALPGRVHTTHGCIQTWLSPADALAQLEKKD
jgi:hypothetical protein